MSNRLFSESRDGAAHAGLYNFRQGQYSYFASRVAGMRAGLNDVVIGVDGDSTARGTATGGDATQHANGWPNRLKGHIIRAGEKSNSENIFGAGGSFSLAQVEGTYDNRLSHTGSGWATTTSNQPAGGYAFRGTGTGVLSFAPRTAFDTIKIYYQRSASINGVVDIGVDGGAAIQSLNTNGSSSVQVLTLTTTLGTHVIDLAWVSGTVNINGIEAYDSTAKQIRVLNRGRHGSSTVDWVSGSGATFGPIDSFGAYAIDLPIVCIGINDWRASTGVSTYKSRMQTLISAYVAAGRPPMLLSPVWDNDATGDSPNQNDYVTAMKELAAENGLAMIDIRRKWQSWAIGNAQGKYSDSVHPLPLGYEDEAATIYRALMMAA